MYSTIDINESTREATRCNEATTEARKRSEKHVKRFLLVFGLSGLWKVITYFIVE
ncbi:hypothetical protein M8C21_009105 [Ambrosia artemisiifolia]|uniref:Uncharacterized protein n=1 Tax=Ambrosia artemisiifolia TaxID=4212 RepID=A0AAD5BW99_AMBAR|nr:hypothetical protein M8C21_009105 [Ambrosia artemisiifolia]